MAQKYLTYLIKQEIMCKPDQTDKIKLKKEIRSIGEKSRQVLQQKGKQWNF